MSCLRSATTMLSICFDSENRRSVWMITGAPARSANCFEGTAAGFVPAVFFILPAPAPMRVPSPAAGIMTITFTAQRPSRDFQFGAKSITGDFAPDPVAPPLSLGFFERQGGISGMSWIRSLLLRPHRDGRLGVIPNINLRLPQSVRLLLPHHQA